jgi:hypothetical protein
MTSSNIEIMQVVARAESQTDLESFLTQEKVEPYRDGQWFKQYRKGGPLEWYNPPFTFSRESFVNVGTREECMERAGKSYDNQLIHLLEVK